MKIISGGQTGADRAGLIAAKAVGFSTGGWMPRYFRADDGNHPDFAVLYNIKEHPSPAYPPRTEHNVLDSDVTIRIAKDWASPGEVLTLSMLMRHHKQHFDIHPDKSPDITDVLEWVARHKPQTINIAGNREKTAPGIQLWSVTYLTELFRLL